VAEQLSATQSGGEQAVKAPAHKKASSKEKKHVVHKQKPVQSKQQRIKRKSTVNEAKNMKKHFPTRSKTVRQGFIAWLMAAVLHTTANVSLVP
jgi:hypothetical protein